MVFERLASVHEEDLLEREGEKGDYDDYETYPL